MEGLPAIILTSNSLLNDCISSAIATLCLNDPIFLVYFQLHFSIISKAQERVPKDAAEVRPPYE
jgi:hypothetical protein